jgi:hypothetical protein
MEFGLLGPRHQGRAMPIAADDYAARAVLTGRNAPALASYASRTVPVAPFITPVPLPTSSSCLAGKLSVDGGIG